MMTDSVSSAEIMDKGINCLIDNLGSVEAEYFISTLLREKGDYTKWRQKYFADVDEKTYYEATAKYGKANPL